MEEKEKLPGKDAVETKTAPQKSEADKKRAQKKGIIIAFSVMAAIVLVWYAVIPGIGALMNAFGGNKEDKPTSDYMDRVVSHTFYPSNYNEDIYADEDYMRRERRISYTTGGSTYYTEIGGDLSQYGASIVFFGEYFDAVIAGEYEDYDKFFTDFYLENQKNKERFTPQKLYDINIRLIGSEAHEGYITNNYYVDFKIEKNNGTFRNDIGSNSARRLVYELIEYDNGTVLINYIGVGTREEK